LKSWKRRRRCCTRSVDPLFIAHLLPLDLLLLDKYP
jgi:hypothetical protein